MTVCWAAHYAGASLSRDKSPPPPTPTPEGQQAEVKFIQTAFVTVFSVNFACLFKQGNRHRHEQRVRSAAIVHSKKTDPWGVFDFFQLFWKILQFSLFSVLKAAFVLLIFQFQVCSTLGKQLSLFRAKIGGFAFSPTSKRSLQVCVVHVPIRPAARRPVADDFAQQTALVRCREDDSKKSDMCWCKRKFPKSYSFVKAHMLFWMSFSFVYLEENVRIPYYVPSSLRQRRRSWGLMFLKSVTVYRTTPLWKNNSREAWKCSVTTKKYFERPHTAVFRRQRLGKTPSTRTGRSFWRQTSSSSSLINTRTPCIIRVVQRSAFVPTDEVVKDHFLWNGL